MFNTILIAKKIKNARIEKNLTQMDVANALNVTYQAVSNWERGNSMPDIGNIVPLAELLGLSVNELLGDDSNTQNIVKIINNDENIKLTSDEIADIAPILPPSKAEELVEIAMSEDRFSFDDLIKLAPYLDEDDIGDTALKLCKQGELNDIASLAPFMSEDAIGKIATMLCDQSKLNDIVSLAPFMNEDDIGKVATKLCEQGKFTDIVALAPFMNEDDIGKVATMLCEQGKFNVIVALAPFMNEDDIGKVATMLCNQGNFNSITALAPFMSEETIIKIIKNKNKF